jgi:anthranilate phosphoribosyltransferase
MGVSDEALMPRIAETLKALGLSGRWSSTATAWTRSAPWGPTRIITWTTADHVEELDPPLRDPTADIDDLAGGDAITNAGIIRDILAGKETGPKKDIVVLNAAAAIIVAGLAEGFRRGHRWPTRPSPGRRPMPGDRLIQDQQYGG